MTTRRRHLAEMQYALAHGCTVLESRRRIARQRQNEADERSERRARCGTLSPQPSEQRQYQQPDAVVDDERWMMRD